MTGSFFTIVVPANSSRREVVSGKFFTCVTLTDSLSVRPNNGAEVDLNQGREFGDASQEFSALTFYNRTGANITTTYYAGPVPYKADPAVLATIGTVNVSVNSTVQNKGTYTKATSASLASAGTVSFPGTDGTNVRKSFSVFNDHATDPLIVRGANGTAGHKVLAQQGYPVETGGGLTLYNPGGAAITYYVMEVFYNP